MRVVYARIPSVHVVSSKDVRIMWDTLTEDLRSHSSAPLAQVKLIDINYGNEGAFFGLLKAGLGRYVNKRSTAFIAEPIPMQFTFSLDYGNRKETIYYVMNVMNHFEYLISGRNGQTDIENLPAESLTCRFPFNGPQYLQLVGKALNKSFRHDGVIYGHEVLPTPQDAASTSILAACQQLIKSNFKQIEKRHARFSPSIYSSTLPKGAEHMSDLTVHPSLPVFKVELDTQKDKTYSLVFSTHFAVILQNDKQGTPVSGQWIYNLQQDSLEYAREKLQRYQAKMPDSYTLNMLGTWLNVCDLRKAVR